MSKASSYLWGLVGLGIGIGLSSVLHLSYVATVFVAISAAIATSLLAAHYSDKRGS
jgi:positive regulator of sigma E activity